MLTVGTQDRACPKATLVVVGGQEAAVVGHIAAVLPPNCQGLPLLTQCSHRMSTFVFTALVPPPHLQSLTKGSKVLPISSATSFLLTPRKRAGPRVQKAGPSFLQRRGHPDPQTPCSESLAWEPPLGKPRTSLSSLSQESIFTMNYELGEEFMHFLCLPW